MGISGLAAAGAQVEASTGAFWLVLDGPCAGILSVLLFGRRLVPRPLIPGLSLVLSPIVTGIAMDWMGELLSERGKHRPALFSFWAGAVFAFGMALVRFVYLEIGWHFLALTAVL